MIESFNRTIKEQIDKYFFANNSRKFVVVLDLLVDQYNNTIHSSIEWLRRKNVVRKNDDKVWKNIYPKLGGKTLAPKV